MNDFKMRSGFTLIELLIAIVLSAIVISIAWFFLSAFLNVGKKQDKINERRERLEFNWGRIEKKLNSPLFELHILENEIQFVDFKEKRHTLNFDDSTLVFDKVSLVTLQDGFKVQINYYGQACNECEFPLDYNSDGFLDEEELDEDGDGFLSSQEVERVKLVEFRLMKGRKVGYESIIEVKTQSLHLL